MASALNVHGKVVTSDGVEHVRAQVIVRDNVARLRSGSADLDTRQNVVRVYAPDPGNRKLRRVEFADGSTWEITRSGGCGCR